MGPLFTVENAANQILAYTIGRSISVRELIVLENFIFGPRGRFVRNPFKEYLLPLCRKLPVQLKTSVGLAGASLMKIFGPAAERAALRWVAA